MGLLPNLIDVRTNIRGHTNVRYWRRTFDSVPDELSRVVLVPGGNGYIFAAIRGLDGTIQLNQGQVASPFVGWQSMGFKSPYSPALSSYGMTTVAVASNSAGHVFYNFWQLGKSGGGWNDLGSSLTNSKPAAALVGSYLFVVIKGRDGQLYLNQGDLGKPFVGWHRLGFSTITAPAATSADNRAVVLGTGVTAISPISGGVSEVGVLPRRNLMAAENGVLPPVRLWPPTVISSSQ
jgi:hypothetical protein